MAQQTQKHNLPVQPTAFVGRADEVAEVTKLLADPACRLLTLIGPGGIGKTRLAVHVGKQVGDNFADGISFVPLHSLRSTDFFIPTIADTLSFPLRGQEDPHLQLFDFLHHKKMLLILDNFEHLLDQPGIDLIADLLQSCLGIKLLVTSQEVLNLQEEWLYHVPALSVPAKVSPALDEYSAVQLFVQHARRVRRDFSLDHERAGVVRICQLVDGIPLALELAAAWTKTLPCAEIADEIQRNIDFLATNLRNVPDRQRSIRAVFDHTWQLLSPPERCALMRLSVFRGGFQREAAEWLADASLPTLSMLVDKSLVRLGADGRYQLHELSRQYAGEQLAQSTEDVAHLYDLHCTYYANFLHNRRRDMSGGRQKEATMEIGTELGNIRVAWQWAVELGKVDEIQKAVPSLDAFYQYQSRYLEGTHAFEKAVRSLEAQTPTETVGLTLAQTLVFLSWLYIRLGRFEEAAYSAERSRLLYDKYEAPPLSGLGSNPLAPLAILAVIHGDYADAVELGETIRRTDEALGDKQNLSFAHYILTTGNAGQGQFEAARRHAQQACDIANLADDRWFLAYCLNEWGNVDRALANYDEAKQHYQASYTIRKDFDDPEGMAVALTHLGSVAILEADYREAQRLYQQGYDLYRDVNDKGGLAMALNGLGLATCGQGDFQAASQYFQQALQITTAMNFIPLTLSILIGAAELLWHNEQRERAIELLSLVYHHPSGERETRDRAKRFLDNYQQAQDLDPGRFTAAAQRGESENLEAMASGVQAKLATLDLHSLEEGESAGLPQPDMSALIEPLTPRELEVLQHLATGLTNQEIAEELIISVGTAKWYTGQIYGKLGVSNRTQAVARARELELLV